MEQYKNLNGNSGVSAFEIKNDSITVQFKKGGDYVCNYSKPGRDKVEQMKKLAIEGRGLNTFISKYVGKDYYKKP